MIIKYSSVRGPFGGLWLFPILFVVEAATESPLGVSNAGSFQDSPMATKRVKSGVTARSVILMVVTPQESRCLPSDS